MIIGQVQERSAKAWVVGSGSPLSEAAILVAYVLASVVFLAPTLPVGRLDQKPTPLMALNLLASRFTKAMARI